MTPLLSTPLAQSLLASLYGRAVESLYPDGALRDVEAVRMMSLLDVDFETLFGAPDGFHALRAAAFDAEVRAWRGAHPGPAVVVELGCGLETQCSRLAGLGLRWVCVDLDEAIALRDTLIPAGRSVTHVRADATAMLWRRHVAPEEAVFVTAQGLLMYLRAADVRALLAQTWSWRPDATLVFDTVTPARASAARASARAPEGRVVPAMRWGVRGSELRARMRRWAPMARVVRWSRCPGRRDAGLPARALDRVAACVVTMAGTATSGDAAPLRDRPRNDEAPA